MEPYTRNIKYFEKNTHVCIIKLLRHKNKIRHKNKNKKKKDMKTMKKKSLMKTAQKQNTHVYI